jgi:anti-anti-sigma factor
MAEARHFRVDISRVGGGVAVSPVGDIDLASADRLRTAMRLEESQAPTVVLDLRGVPFMDSSGLGVIVHENRTARERGARFAVAVGGQPAVRRILELSGLSSVLELVDDPSDVLAG